MPSRKRAKGQERKAKRAEACSCPGACDHFDRTPGNWSPNDWDAAENLYDEFGFKANSLLADENGADRLWELVHQTYEKYHEFNDARKDDVFRRSVLAYGTELCVAKAKETDLTKEDYIKRVTPFYLMIITIEVRNKNNGMLDGGIASETLVHAFKKSITISRKIPSEHQSATTASMRQL
eukprot:scaffold17228_cov49-Cyclotella_meneghiniana.AAC.8